MNGTLDIFITAIVLIILFAWSVGFIEFGNDCGNMKVFLPVINIL